MGNLLACRPTRHIAMDSQMSRRDTTKTIPRATIIRGRDLWVCLGFKNARAFQRAYKKGQIGLRLYPIPGQSRGFFARADELAAYLTKKNGIRLHDRAGEGGVAYGEKPPEPGSGKRGLL